MLLVSSLLLLLCSILIVDLILGFREKVFLSYEQKAFSMIGLIVLSIIAAVFSPTTDGMVFNGIATAIWGWNLYTLQTRGY